MTRRVQERGAATAEYAGAIFVAAAIVIAVIAAVPVGGGKPIAGAIYNALCRALGISCAAQATADRARDLGIKCIVNQRDRKLGYNGSFRFVQVDREDGDTLIEFGDGSGAVRVSQGGQLSGTLGTDDRKKGYRGKHRAPSIYDGASASADGKIGLRGDVIYQYNFPTEYGGYETAKGWTESNQSTTNRAIQIVGGPGVTTLREGGGRLARWASEGIDDLVTGSPSAEEQAARDRNAGINGADVISFKTSLQGEGNVKGEAGVVRGAGQATGSIEGQTDIAITTGGPARLLAERICLPGWWRTTAFTLPERSGSVPARRGSAGR
ncbi:hypothetical protein ACQP1U_00725 [Actinomycetota bacterium]